VGKNVKSKWGSNPKGKVKRIESKTLVLHIMGVVRGKMFVNLAQAPGNVKEREASRPRTRITKVN